jgi:ribosome-associated toxin RatA of RatAB toxin-antitoxin module
MRQVEILANVNGYRAGDAYALLGDFQRYPAHSTTVRTVTILETQPDRTISSWEVNFRQGILQWIEEDCFDRVNQTIRFNQLEGDAEHFSGEWRVMEQAQACQIYFTAKFDMGVPTMADIIEPIAERALRENIQSIIAGLFQTQVEYR